MERRWHNVITQLNEYYKNSKGKISSSILHGMTWNKFWQLLFGSDRNVSKNIWRLKSYVTGKAYVKHQRQKVKSLTNDLSHEFSQRYVNCIYKFLHKKKIFQSPYDIFNKSSISYSLVRDGSPSLTHVQTTVFFERYV